MNLRSAVEDFLLACSADGLSKTTLKWYRSILMRFTLAVMGDFSSLTITDIRQYIADLRKTDYSDDTVNGHIRALHRFFRWCSAEYNQPNPMTNIRYPKQATQGKPKAVNLEDLVRMFEVTQGSEPMKIRDRAILALLTDTGARAAGIVGLEFGDIDLVRRQAIVNEKGRKLRAVVFTEFTAKILQLWLDVRDVRVGRLFYNLNTGRPLTVSGLYQLCRRLAREAGVQGRFNPHAFRHGFAREYLFNGGDFATLSRLMGHSDISTTANFYAVFSADELARQHEQFSPMANPKIKQSLK